HYIPVPFKGIHPQQRRNQSTKGHQVRIPTLGKPKICQIEDNVSQTVNIVQPKEECWWDLVERAASEQRLQRGKRMIETPLLQSIAHFHFTVRIILRCNREAE